MAVLDIAKYYQAAHLTRLIDWCRNGHYKRWVEIEQQICPIALSRAPWCYNVLPSKMKKHPIIGPTLLIAAKICKNPKFSTKCSPLIPILGNPGFIPGTGGVVFNKLKERGKVQASHFLQKNTWPSIEDLTKRRGSYELSFWQALQLSYFLRSLGQPYNFRRQLTKFEQYCEDEEPIQRVSSKMYRLLISPQEDFELPGLGKWERDLGRVFSQNQRKQIIYLALYSSTSTRIQESNYKLLSQWYYKQVKLHKFSKDNSEYCWRCGLEQGTTLHIFWSCVKVRDYWKEVQRIVQKFTERQIPDDPALYLLHSSQIPMQEYKKSVICHLINTAKTGITLQWRESRAPSIARWLNRVREIGAIEDLILSTRNKREQYEETWSRWNQFMKSEEGKRLLEE